jgi:hypothetical protein
MNKTIIIGIGGTGLRAINELRRLIAEYYEQGLQAPEVASVKFLYIDTDQKEITKLEWTVLEKPIELQPAEKVIITGSDLLPMAQKPENYPNIRPLLPSVGGFIGDPGTGAEGIRPFGRLIYESTENKDKIHLALSSCYESLNRQFQNPNLRFYVIAGLSGGTGSGMFLPLSFDLINLGLYRKGTTELKFHGFFVLPPRVLPSNIQKSGMRERYHPNAFAALKEINYHASQQTLPYDNCYLLEPVNTGSINVDLKDLPIVIAKRIFINIQGGEAGDRIDSIMDNPALGNEETDNITGAKHAFRFSSFGIENVGYPQEIVYQCLSKGLAASVVSVWNNQKSYSEQEKNKSVRTQVKEDLNEIRLSKSHCKGDSDQFGNKLQNSYEIEIQNDVSTKFRDVVKKKLTQKADLIREEIEEEFRGQGINNYYKELNDGITDAVDIAIKLTKEKVTSYVIKPEYGFDFGKRYLEELIKELEDFKGGDEGFVEKSSEKSQKRIDRARRNLTNSITSIAKKEASLLPYLSFAQDKQDIQKLLIDYLSSLADFRANEYGLKFVDEICKQIKTIQNNLTSIANKIDELAKKMQGKVALLLEETSTTTQKNGKVLFNQESLKELLKQIGEEKAKEEIEKRLCQTQKQTKLDFTKLLESPNLEQEIEDVAYDWVVSEHFTNQIRSTNLYDKFEREYPKADDRRTILESTRKLASPFLGFDREQQDQTPLKKPVSTEIVTAPKFDDNNQAEKNIRQTLTRDLAVGEIQNSNDQDRITFVQEVTGFPLRYIRSVKFLQGEYEKYPFKEALHIDKAIVEQLYDLYLVTPEQIKAKEEAEEVFVLARALNWITLETNDKTNKKEILYKYKEERTSGTQFVVLGYGADWYKTLNEFAKDAFILIANPNAQSNIREARQRLTREYQQLCDAAKRKTKIYEKIHATLDQFLSKCLEEYQSERDSCYQHYQTIVNRIQTKIYNEE